MRICSLKSQKDPAKIFPPEFIKLKTIQMKIAITSLFLIISLSSCNFSKSFNKDLISGLLTKGDGLSCESVYLTINGEKVERNTFVYGEQFLVNFNNIEGFKKENENAFPGMKMVVLSKTGDTVLQSNDLYDKELNFSPLLLTSDVTVAVPMKSKNDYTLHVYIWDKKGSGKFSAAFDFKIIPNGKIITESNKVSFNEIYLFSKERSKVLTDNKMRLNENTYIILEGLTGFKEENGMVFPGLGFKGTDSDGKTILDYEDLFADYSKNGLAVADFNAQVASHFILSTTEFKSPLHFELTIWDRKSDAKMTSKADLTVE
jgi:hypothetical protein